MVPFIALSITISISREKNEVNVGISTAQGVQRAKPIVGLGVSLTAAKPYREDE